MDVTNNFVSMKLLTSFVSEFCGLFCDVYHSAILEDDVYAVKYNAPKEND